MSGFKNFILININVSYRRDNFRFIIDGSDNQSKLVSSNSVKWICCRNCDLNTIRNIEVTIRIYC